MGDHKTPVFRARDLVKTYRVGDTLIPALRGVDLELFQGEIVVLLGPSGSGKSSLLNILGGLDSASSGSVFYREHDLVKSSDEDLTRFRREHVGFVFQFYNLIPSLTAAENVSLAADLSEHALDPQSALSMVGLAGLESRFPSQLSGGEQQRVAIARAVAKQPDILLCDEPTGALDLATGKCVLQAIIDVNRKWNTLVVLITHNAAIAKISDRVVHLGDGKIRSIEVHSQRGAVGEVEW